MKKIVLIFVLPVLAGMIISCSSSDSTPQSNSGAQAQTPERPALAGQSQTTTPVTREPRSTVGTYSGITVFDLAGNKHDLTEWVGREPVVVNIWGTWCPPCRREIPGLVKLYGEYKKRGVEIVSLAMERSAGPEQVKMFTEQAGMQWVQLIANQDIAVALGFSGSVPTTIFFDASGREVARHVGARDYDTFKTDFEKIAGS